MRMGSTQIMSNIRRAGRLALSFDVIYGKYSGLCATLLTIIAQHEELQGKSEIEFLARFLSAS